MYPRIIELKKLPKSIVASSIECRHCPRAMAITAVDGPFAGSVPLWKVRLTLSPCQRRRRSGADGSIRLGIHQYVGLRSLRNSQYQ
jgi:hypothetical protein